MDIFIARQPIFNQHKRLFAYKLLYRGTKSLPLGNVSGNKATTSVLSSAFLTEGIDRISGLRPCFINFTRELLLQNIPASFAKNVLIVEVREDVPPTPDVVGVCQKLKKDGYTIALDNFVYHPNLVPLIEIASIIKFDFRISSLETIRRTLHFLSGHDLNLKYLAEKVETHAEFQQALRMGFTYFQGSFFCKPERIRIHEVDSIKINLINLLAEVNRKSTTVGRVEKIIQGDVGLAYKLLRYINSSYFYLLNKIESVRHAITYLGEKEFRRFIILVLVSELATDKPSELVRLALVRAKMCELLAQQTSLKDKDDELFLLGLFSLLDAMLDNTMDYVCDQLSLSDALKNALVEEKGAYYPYLQAVISYEKREKNQCLAAVETLGINPSSLHPHYLTAIDFAQKVFV